MKIFSDVESGGSHEQVVFCVDPTVGYRAIIAVHSTVLGPATGGTRFWTYRNTAAALDDVLRLSRSMTYKAALAGLPAGGGKSVILAPRGSYSKPALMRAHGRAVDALRGRYVTAVDVGLSTADLEEVARETSFVALHRQTHGAGGEDTARGVFAAVRAATTAVWSTDSLAGLVVAVQGCGNVGLALVNALIEAGASVIAADLDAARTAMARRLGADIVPTADIFTVDADMLAPCALGQTITPRVAAQTHARAIVGGANNQLANASVADTLAARDILYVPDFVANAGGMIAGVSERVGLDVHAIRRRIDAIEHSTRTVVRAAFDWSVTPVVAAHRLADDIIAAKSRERAACATSVPIP